MIFNKYVSVILVTVLTYMTSFSQELIPPITNYSPQSYEASAQNWDMDFDDLGFLYVANNQGLLEYNGLSWTIYELPNSEVIRSVFVKDDLIYTGAYSEFGFWKRDSTGQLVYTSLTSKAEGFSINEEIWQITSNRDLIYLRSFGKIYVYDGEEITIAEGLNSNAMISFKGELFIADRQKGLCELAEDGVVKVDNPQSIIKERIIDFSKDDDRLLIATKSKLYEFRNGKIKAIGNESLWEQLKRWEVNKIELIDASTLVLGTVKNGVIFYDLSTSKIKLINRTNGLQNNTVLALENLGNSLWLGLDYGIDKVNLYSPIHFFTENSGELGTVYDVEELNKTTYLGSNTGVYGFNKNNLELLKGTEGHTWNLSTYQNKLFINHNTGTYAFSGNNLNTVESKTGSFKIQQVEEKKEYLIGTYTGLRYFKDTITDIPALNFPVKDFLLQNTSDLWLLGLYDGLYKAELNTTYSEITKKEISIPNGSNDINTRIMTIENQFAVFNDGEWYKYNPFENQLEEFEDFKFLKNKKPIVNNGDFYWFLDIKNKSFYITNFEDFHYDLNSEQLKSRLVKNYENVIFKSDSTFIVTLKDGYAEIDLSQLNKTSSSTTKFYPEVIGIKSENERFDLDDRDLPYKRTRDLHINVAYPSSNPGDLHFKLTSLNTIKSGMLNGGEIYLQNLYEGDYILEFFVEDTKQGDLDLGVFKFTVSPPWYNSVYMRIVYIILSLMIIYIIFKINKIKLKKQKHRLISAYEEHQEEEAKRQEKEKLIGELNIKSKELANTTLTLAKKNEILLELEKEIKNNQDAFKNKYKLKTILIKINNALNNKNEWEVFETNFNEIHDEFFKKLLQSYPDLTNSDLRLCAYLKMNMTSKEIAPLLRISLRGVEVHRYRLRKKLNLSSQESLNKFLIKNF